MSLRKNESGVTIIELMIAIAVASAVSVAMLAISLTFFGSVIRSQIKAQMAADSHYALRSIIEDVRIADGIAQETTLIDDNEPAGNWITDQSRNILVLTLPAIDGNRDIIYNEETGDPYNNELIYFIEDGRLYKRFVKNESAPGNTTETSCPEAISSSSCPSDRFYAPNVGNMSFVFYDQSNTVTTDPTLARSVEITIEMDRQSFGSVVTLTNTIFTKLRN